MGEMIVCQSNQCRNGDPDGSWSDIWTKNPMFIGVYGSFTYVGEWRMDPTNLAGRNIRKITLNIYRNSTTATENCELYIGCSRNAGDVASLMSTGVKVVLSAGEGWKAVDVTGLADHISAFDSTWYLLIGNPADSKTSIYIAGYGSQKMLYLDVEVADDTGGAPRAYHIYLAQNGAVTPYTLYQVQNGVLTPCTLYLAENNSLTNS